MGAWIETQKAEKVRNPNTVAPYVGAWIETGHAFAIVLEFLKSHPTWVRGLKHNAKSLNVSNVSVAPYVGAWIETA